MKKIIASLVFFGVCATAMATDATVNLGRNFGSNTNTLGLTVGQQFSDFRGFATLGRAMAAGQSTNVLGLGVSRPVGALGPVVISATAGIDYYSVASTANGFGATVGVEAVYPLTSDVQLVSGFQRVVAPNRINGFNGNQFTVGVRSSFN